MKTCAFCGKETTNPKCCSPECRREYNRTVVIGTKECKHCGAMFDFTVNSQYRKFCRQGVCRSAVWRTREPDFGHEEHPAPPHVRKNYCVQSRNGAMVRCAKHEETCSDGCYREENGRPVCRVEPAMHPVPLLYASNIACNATPRVDMETIDC